MDLCIDPFISCKWFTSNKNHKNFRNMQNYARKQIIKGGWCIFMHKIMMQYIVKPKNLCLWINVLMSLSVYRRLI